VTARLEALEVLGDGTSLVAVGSDLTSGAIVIIDGRHAAALDAVARSPGSAGDAAMRAALEALPAEVPRGPVVAPRVAEFALSIEDRASLESQRDAARTRADEIRTGGFSLTQRRQDFAEFMRTCRTEAATTQHCTEAYVALRQAETQTVWEILAERAPQAILLLFLLATLGGLYRYNIRLAGFHHGRADALELFADSGGGTPETLTALAEALAADKVAFGKGNTPSDQAMEIARAVLSRNP
jgi:hypothetical protein